MTENLFSFKADYRDGRVYVGGKVYAAGLFATHLLNRFYLNDTAARIAVFSDEVNNNIVRQLENGYLNISEFVSTGRNILEAMKSLPKLHPFDTLDNSSITDCITNLFTVANGERICAYLSEKAKVSMLPQDEVAVGTAYRYAERTDKEAETMIKTVISILSFFNNVSADLISAHDKLTAFEKRIDEVERFDEKHLLPIALEVFGQIPFPLTTEYISLKKNKASSGETVARRLTFDRYIAFVLTDFFEGLHYGHYPRRCGVCKKYFLMQSARRQQYCMGIVPEQIRGQNVTCRRYAASMKRKEKAENDPISATYTNRCSAIRTEVKRGTIPSEIGEAAKALALEHKKTALMDDNYAKRQYKKDMSREKLYRDAGLK